MITIEREFISQPTKYALKYLKYALKIKKYAKKLYFPNIIDLSSKP